MAEKEVASGKDADSAAAKSSEQTQLGQATAEGENKTALSAAASDASASSAASGEPDRSAIELLKRDHRRVEELFSQYEKASARKKDEIVQKVCRSLTIHTMLEEMVFYPACRQAAEDEEPLDEAQVEHDGAKVLISDLASARGGDEFRDAKVKVLSEYIKHHVGEEEAPGKGIFAKAKAAGLDTPELAVKIGELKKTLEAREGELSPSPLVSIRPPSGRDRYSQEEIMARQQGSDRDERGRFVSDDDRRDRASGRDRDDDRSYRSRGRDDDDGRGWYGDSEGHSEASRRGWAERRGESRSFQRDDDDDRRSYRTQERERDDRGRFMSDDDRGYRSGGRDDRDRDDRGRFARDDDRGSYRSQGGQDRDRDDRGRFVSDDDRGGSRSRGRNDDDDRGYRSRGRDDDDGRGRGGWFGDSRGHAEAARRGWEERDGASRGRSRDDEDDRRSYRSRSRDDDDDRDRQGGWFGDSRGHAEAARRGWENRR